MSRVLALSLIILAAGVVADEDDYIIHHRDAPEADHFEDVLGMVEIGSGAKRQVTDIRLPRYA